MKAAFLAEALLKRQPLSIQERLVRDENFLSSLGLMRHSGVEINGVRLHLGDLFHAARLAEKEGSSERVRLIGEDTTSVTKRDGKLIVVFERNNESIELSLDLLDLVSESSERRVEALKKVAGKIGPTEDLSDLQRVVAERPLLDGEISSIIDYGSDGVASLLARIEFRFREQGVAVSDWIPDSLEYFEKVCGPRPGSLGSEEYVSSVLPVHRKTLLGRDIKQGLSLCMVGALDYTLLPAPWLEEVEPDQLWDLLSDLRPQLDPVSLLSALDVCLYRQDDSRFSLYAEQAVTTLVQDEFVRQDGVDCYEVIPSIARFVLGRIQVLEGGALVAPFWKRICAWTQANLIARVMHGSGVSAEQVLSLLKQSTPVAAWHVDSFDLRREPMAKAGEMSEHSFRGMVLLQLARIRAHHQSCGREVPGAEEIERSFERFAAAGPPLSRFLPGPLRGAEVPLGDQSELPGEVEGELQGVRPRVLVENLSNLSQHFSIPEDLRNSLGRVVSQDLVHDDIAGIKELVDLCWLATAVAASARDTDLALSISKRIIDIAPRLVEESLLGICIDTLLRAGAAFEEEASWACWLEAQFLEFARRIPPGKIANAFWLYIQELKAFAKLELGIFRRAEALASSAALL